MKAVAPDTGNARERDRPRETARAVPFTPEQALEQERFATAFDFD